MRGCWTLANRAKRLSNLSGAAGGVSQRGAAPAQATSARLADPGPGRRISQPLRTADDYELFVFTLGADNEP